MLNLINFRLLGSMSKNFVDLSEVHYPRLEQLEFGLIISSSGSTNTSPVDILSAMITNVRRLYGSKQEVSPGELQLHLALHGHDMNIWNGRCYYNIIL